MPSYSLSARTGTLLVALLVVLGSVSLPVGTVGADSPPGTAGPPAAVSPVRGPAAVTELVNPANLTSGAVVWSGQTLFFQGGAAEDNGTYRLYNLSAGGRFMTEIDLDENASAVLPTRGFGGSYYLTDADGDPIVFDDGQRVRVGSPSAASFEVVSQTLSADLGTADVVTEPPGDLEDIPLAFDSNRASFDLVVTWETPEDLSGSEAVAIFDDAFPGATAVDVDDEEPGDDAVLLPGVTRTGDYSIDLTGLPTGDYDFFFAPADATAFAEVTIDIVEPSTFEAAPDPRELTVARGDVATFEIELDDTRNATVVVGQRDLNYLANLSVTDGDRDDEVTIDLNTYTAGRQAGSIALDPDHSAGDGLVVDSGETTATGTTGPLTDVLAPAVYPISVSGNPLDEYQSTVDDPQAFGTLSVVERRTEGVQILRAPDARWDDLEEASDVRGGLDRGWVTPSDSIAAFDDHTEVLVAQIEATGIFGAYETASGTGVERLAALQGTYNVSIEQTGASTGPNIDPIALDLAASDATGVEVFPDQDHQSLYVVVRPQSPGAVWERDGSPVALDTDADYRVEFRVPADSPLSTDEDTDQVVNATATIEEADVSWAGGDPVGVLPRADQTLTASTNMAPETELTLRLRSTDSSNFTFQTRDVEVAGNGSIAADFDFEALPPGTEFTLRVLKGSEEIAEDDGIVLAPEPTTTTPTPTTTTTVTTTTTPTTTTPTSTTTTPTPTTSTTPTSTTSTTRASPTTTTTTTPGPGMAAGLLAVVAAVLLARRRRRD